jgi:hypothetical protein
VNASKFNYLKNNPSLKMKTVVNKVWFWKIAFLSWVKLHERKLIWIFKTKVMYIILQRIYNLKHSFMKLAPNFFIPNGYWIYFLYIIIQKETFFMNFYFFLVTHCLSSELPLNISNCLTPESVNLFLSFCVTDIIPL